MIDNTARAAIVLAGGMSRRLGRDKASALLQGRPLLQHVLDHLDGVATEIIIVKAAGQTLPPFSTSAEVSVVEDLQAASGPLAGLYTGLLASRAEAAVAVGCDMPLLRPALLRALLEMRQGFDAAVPTAGDGQVQPLCAVYSKGCIPAIKRHLEGGRLQVTGIFKDLRVREVPPEEWRTFDPEGLSFFNVNSEEDLAAAEAVLRQQARPREGGRPCQVWYGQARCRQTATHRTEHSGVLVCAMHASIWGGLYEEVEDEDEEAPERGI